MFKTRLLPMQRSKIAKKILLVSFLAIFLLLILPSVSFAQDDQFGLESAANIGLAQGNLVDTVVNIIRFFLGFLGLIAVILMMYGGFIWMTSGGDPAKIDKAKRILINAIIGIIIILSAFIITAFVINFLGGGSGGGGNGEGGGGIDDPTRWGIGVGPIESVSPYPQQTDVYINTGIAITFKETINPATICNDNPDDPDGVLCNSGDIMKNIEICAVGENGICMEEGDFISSVFEDSTISSNNNRTFTIIPDELLGYNDFQNRVFKVTLESGIETMAEPDRSVFAMLIGNTFAWQFTTNGEMDLDPPEIVDVTGVYPYPDYSADDYFAVAEPSPATFNIIWSGGPIQNEIDATYSEVVTGGGSPSATLSGVYDGTGDGDVEVNIISSGDVITTWPDGTTFDAGVYNGGLLLNIGTYGIVFHLDGVASPGNQWEFSVTPRVEGDKLEILEDGDVIKSYTFGVDISASNYVDVIVADNGGIFTDCETPETCDIKTVVTGQAANKFKYSFNYIGGATFDFGYTAGAEATSGRTQVGRFDVYKNTIIKISFNETINPSAVTSDNILVWREGQRVFDYTLELSPDYKTIEITPAGTPCGINSCGEEIYCWPVASGDDANEYRVEIVASTLMDSGDSRCSEWGGGQSNRRCWKVVGGKDVFYPLYNVADGVNGIVDMSFNSFNGSFNTYEDGGRVRGIAEGQSDLLSAPHTSGKDPFDLNLRMECDSNIIPVSCNNIDARIVSYGESSDFGDNFEWSFYISNQIDTQAPLVKSVVPIGDENVSSANASVTLTFDRLMRNSTLKPGWNYGSTEKERSQRYLVLQTISASALPVGYWIGGYDEDEDFDGWADVTVADISHSNFDSFRKYGPLGGSGLQSITQNCFLPSAGPLAASGGCEYDGEALGGNCAQVADNPASYGYLNCDEIEGTVDCTDDCKVSYYDPDNPETDVYGSWVITKDYSTIVDSETGRTNCCFGVCVE
ncbi:MAG: hypothetical protein ABH884_04560 [Candidatus Komeilibacteria bacterium]